MMSDHWKLLANLLGTPGPVDPNPSDTSAKPAAPTAPPSTAAPPPAASPADRNPLVAMTAKEPDKLVPGFEIPEPPPAPEKPARRSAWDTLIGTLGIKVSEEVETVVTTPPPTPTHETKSTSFAESNTPSRSTRSGSFGAGLVGDSNDDEPRARSRESRGSHLNEDAAPAAPKSKTGATRRVEERDVPTRRSPESSGKPNRTSFADGLIDWDATGEDDAFVSDSDDFAGHGDEFETVAEKDSASERDSDDRPRRRGRRGRGRNRGRDRDDREPRGEARDDAFVDDVDRDHLATRRDDFDLDDEPIHTPARDELARDETARGDSRRQGRRGERQRLGTSGPAEPTPAERTSGRAPRDRAASERSSGERVSSDRPQRGERGPRGERVPRERTPVDRPTDHRGPADRTRQSHSTARSDFDFDDDLGEEAITNIEQSAPTARTDREPGDRPRRRRGRRGRGGAGREGAPRDADRAGSTGSHGLRDSENDFDDEPPFAPELAVDQLEPAGTLDDDHEDHEDVEQMRRGRRRRRGGRGRGGDRGPERSADDLSSGDTQLGEDAFAAPARQRSVPTWLDTVNLLVDANIERHQRSGGNSRQGGNRGPRR